MPALAGHTSILRGVRIVRQPKGEKGTICARSIPQSRKNAKRLTAAIVPAVSGSRTVSEHVVMTAVGLRTGA